MEALIELKDFSFRYKGCEHWALRDVTLTIRKGQYILLCGASGSGKSTLSLALSGLIPHFIEGELSGGMFFLGQHTSSMSMDQFLSRVGLVFQNSDAQLFNATVFSEMAYGLESLSVPSYEIERRIMHTAMVLDIIHLLDRRPEDLSGGEKRLAALGSVLCLDPEVLVLDEPFSNLDPEGIRRLKDVLFSLNKSGKTLVLIEQRITRALGDAGRCVIMEEGRVAFDGVPESAVKLIGKAGLIPSFTDRAREHGTGGEILSIKALTGARGGREVIRDISLSVRKGEIVAVLGKNGAGKTTLARHLNGLALPVKGDVVIDGKALTRKNAFSAARAVGVSFQNPNDQFFKTTVREEIRAGASTPGPYLEELIDLFGLRPLLDRQPYFLSEGQKKKVALASILALEPKVLVLDEPTIGQDGRSLTELASILIRLRDSGMGIVIVTHDLSFAEALCDRWVFMKRGCIKAEGAGSMPPEGWFFQ